MPDTVRATLACGEGEKKRRDGCALDAPQKKISFLINQGLPHLKLFDTSFISEEIDCIPACLTTEVTKVKKRKNSNTWINWPAVATHYVALAYFVVVGELGEDLFIYFHFYFSVFFLEDH